MLDASALVDVVLDQPTTGWVLDEIADEEVCAPAHQPAEVLSALARLVRAAQVDLGSARDALDEDHSPWSTTVTDCGSGSSALLIRPEWWQHAEHGTPRCTCPSPGWSSFGSDRS